MEAFTKNRIILFKLTLLVVIVLLTFASSSLASSSLRNRSIERKGNFDVALEILTKEGCFENKKNQVSCCRKKLANYPKQWFHGGHYLQNIFVELKALECSQIIKMFCSARLYRKLSSYSDLVYEYHCNPQQFQRKCSATVARIRNMNESLPWGSVTTLFNSSTFSLTELMEPCMQLAAYQSPSGGYGFFHEVIAFDIPFCSNLWCGFDAKTMKERGITHWDCMPSRCKAGIIVISVLCGLLSAAIAIGNVTVIVVFSTTPKIRNSQAVYKISLAMADLVVGLLVLPSIIHSLLHSYQSQPQLGDPIPNVERNSDGMEPRRPISPAAFRFTPEYIGFIGFCTSLSLMVSIYTLMMASFDRLLAICSPLKYSRHRAKRVAIWSSLSLWTIGLIFSALPLFIPDMPFGVVASVLVVSIKTPALVMYAVVVVLPLILVWITTICAYVVTVRSSLTNHGESNNSNTEVSSIETRLARTLATMVGTFTICLLPTIITLLIPLGISNINPDHPRKFDPTANNIFTSAEFVAILILMTNSLWNCFIYNSRNNEFKRRVRYFYTSLCTREGQRGLQRSKFTMMKLPWVSRTSTDKTSTTKKAETSSTSRTKENSTDLYGRQNNSEVVKNVDNDL